MSEMEEKLGAILNNPQMMQQIMTMAQAMNASSPPQESPQKSQEMVSSPQFPSIDPRMLRSLAGMAQNSGVDQNQQSLLKALRPYLSQNRVNKLERAMRAAKMAGLASNFLNAGGLQLLGGR